ncbi:MAG: putative glycosyl transferase [Enterovirga sp.]|nr:putative glycosyl transferase [Enterovirga sp.]
MAVSVMLALFFTALMRIWGLYDPRNILTIEKQIRSAILAWSISLGLTLALLFLLKTSAELSRGALLVFAALGLSVVVGHRLVWRFALKRAHAHGAIRRKRGIVLSSVPWPEASGQIAALNYAGIEVTERVFLPVEPAERAEALRKVIASTRQDCVEEIILLMSTVDLPKIEAVMEALRPLPLPIRLLPDATLSRIALQPSRAAARFALIDLTRGPLGAGELGLKRALDLVVASAALLAAAPLLVLAMAAIRLESPGPALFRQSRRGFNGRSFKILKLRTMTCMEDGDGVAQAQRHDPRVTRVGAWLRRTSIDELPQLWNVLRGEMSVVGPRPHAVAHDSFYDSVIENYAFRHHVKPGLTGWAQVSGHRGETPLVAMMAARVDHDVWYVNNWSLLLDLRILMLTCTRLLGRMAY